jgi:hypothetical protein
MIRHAVSENPPAGGSLAEAPKKRAVVSNPVPLWRSLVILALGILVWLLYWTKPVPALPPEAGVVMSLPPYLNLGLGYVGEDAEVTPAEHRILPKDTGFERKNYRDFLGPNQIFCSIVLSGAQQQSIHRPEVCLVAQGWSIINAEDLPIRLKSGRELTVRNLTIRRTISHEGRSITITGYNMYWFVGENVTTPSHLTRVFLTSWDRIFHNRAHRWAYVTVSSPITKDLRPDGLDAAQTRALLVAFIREVVPYFQKSEMSEARVAAP